MKRSGRDKWRKDNFIIFGVLSRKKYSERMGSLVKLGSLGKMVCPYLLIHSNPPEKLGKCLLLVRCKHHGHLNRSLLSSCIQSELTIVVHRNQLEPPRSIPTEIGIVSSKSRRCTHEHASLPQFRFQVGSPTLAVAQRVLRNAIYGHAKCGARIDQPVYSDQFTGGGCCEDWADAVAEIVLVDYRRVEPSPTVHWDDKDGRCIRFEGLGGADDTCPHMSRDGREGGWWSGRGRIACVVPCCSLLQGPDRRGVEDESPSAKRIVLPLFGRPMHSSHLL